MRVVNSMFKITKDTWKKKRKKTTTNCFVAVVVLLPLLPLLLSFLLLLLLLLLSSIWFIKKIYWQLSDCTFLLRSTDGSYESFSIFMRNFSIAKCLNRLVFYHFIWWMYVVVVVFVQQREFPNCWSIIVILSESFCPNIHLCGASKFYWMKKKKMNI